MSASALTTAASALTRGTSVYCAISGVSVAAKLGHDVVKRMGFWGYDQAAAGASSFKARWYQDAESAKADEKKPGESWLTTASGYFYKLPGAEAVVTYLTPVRPDAIKEQVKEQVKVEGKEKPAEPATWKAVASHCCRELGKAVLYTFAAAVLWDGANYVLGASKFDVNAVLQYVSPLRLSNDYVLTSAWTGLGQVYAWGAETAASFRA